MTLCPARQERMLRRGSRSPSGRNKPTAQTHGVPSGEPLGIVRQRARLSFAHAGSACDLAKRVDGGQGHELQSEGKRLAYAWREVLGQNASRLCSGRDRCPRLESFDEYEPLARGKSADDAEAALLEQRVGVARRDEWRRG